MPANDCVPFFPSDYRGDPNVETLSYAGKGLWAELFILMMMTGGILVHANKQIRETDYALIAKATRGDPKDARRIMPELKNSGVYSVTEEGVIFSRKLVEMTAKRKKKSAAGAEGGKATAQANAAARAKAEVLKHSLSTAAQSRTIPLHANHLASLADSAREASTTAAATKSPAFAFCQWMLDEGLKRGVIGAHFAGDPFAWCYKQLGAAETLVNAYGEAECRARSERFFTASAGRRIRRIVNAISLLAVWDWDEIRTQTPPPEDEFIRELRAAEAH